MSRSSLLQIRSMDPRYCISYLCLLRPVDDWCISVILVFPSCIFCRDHRCSITFQICCDISEFVYILLRFASSQCATTFIMVLIQEKPFPCLRKCHLKSWTETWAFLRLHVIHECSSILFLKRILFLCQEHASWPYFVEYLKPR